MYKRVTALILAIVLIICALIGCSKQSDTNPNSGGDSGDEPIEITIATWFLDPAFLEQEDLVYEMLKEKFNITINPVVLTWSDYTEKISTWMATGDGPDIFTTDMISGTPQTVKTFYTWVEDELIRPLPTDLSAYPNLQRIFEYEDCKLTQVNGRYWAIPRLRGDLSDNGWATNHGWYYRKDWAANLGFDEIETYDDLMAFLYAVRDGDPTGTGATNIIPLTGPGPVYPTYVMWGIFEPRLFGSWQYEDGELYRAFDAPHSYDAALALRNMYNEGLIDPDILLSANNDLSKDKFAANKVAVYCYQMFSNDDVFDKFIANNPGVNIEDAIGFLPFLPNIYDGNTYCFDWPTNFWAETYISSNVSDEKFEKILELLDYTSSQEWIDLFMYGIESVDYEVDGDTIVYLTEDGSRPDVKSKYPVLNGTSELTMLFEGKKFSPLYTKYPYVSEMCDGFHDAAAANVPMPNTALTFMISTPEDEEYVDDSLDRLYRFMFSGSTGDPKAEWDAMMQDMRDAGLDEVVDAKVEAVKAAGRLS